MSKRLLTLLLILAVIAGAVGAVASVAMVISAVQFLEWGRVVFYSVTTGFCVEVIVLAIGRLRKGEQA